MYRSQATCRVHRRLARRCCCASAASAVSLPRSRRPQPGRFPGQSPLPQPLQVGPHAPPLAMAPHLVQQAPRIDTVHVQVVKLKPALSAKPRYSQHRTGLRGVFTPGHERRCFWAPHRTA